MICSNFIEFDGIFYSEPENEFSEKFTIKMMVDVNQIVAFNNTKHGHVTVMFASGERQEINISYDKLKAIMQKVGFISMN